MKIVNLWLKLEVDGKGVGGKLAAKGRPKCVGYWISVARPNRLIDLDTSFKDFEMVFWKWWRSLQPQFRTEGLAEGQEMVRKLPPTEEREWEALRATGTNGLVSVLAALAFWGRPVLSLPMAGYRNQQTRDAEVSRWLKAIIDVEFALAEVSK